MTSLGLGGKDLFVIDSSETRTEKLGGEMVIAKRQSTGE